MTVQIHYKQDALYPEYKTVHSGENMTNQKRRIEDRLPGQPLQWEEDSVSAEGAVDWRPYHSALSQCAELLDNMPEGDSIFNTPKYLSAKLATHAAPSAAAGEPATDVKDIQNRELELDRIALYWEDQSRRGCADAFQCAIREAWDCGSLAHPAAPVQPPHRPTDDDLWDQTLRDRDTYHEWADKLADAIAQHFGADIGEHSNMNCPWSEALDAIEHAEESPYAKLNVAIKWINDAPHGDNCFVSDHYEGDPGDRCNCGKDALVDYLESAAPVQPMTDQREAFEAWHRSKFATKHSTGQPTRDMHNGIYAEKYGPKNQQQMWEAWQARGASQVQPVAVPAGDLRTDAVVMADDLRRCHETEDWNWDRLLEAAAMIDRLLAAAPSPAAEQKAEQPGFWMTERELRAMRRILAVAGVGAAETLDTDAAMPCFWSLIGQIANMLEKSAAPSEQQAAPEHAGKVCGQCFGKGVMANIHEICEVCNGSGRMDANGGGAPSPIIVKAERNCVWIVKGVQSFMLAYEADTDEELQWYASQLRGVLSGFTHDVKPSPTDAAVNRFLGWPLPDSLSARLTPNVTKPIGTHIMNADEARAMFEYCLAAPAGKAAAEPLTDERIEAIMKEWSRSSNSRKELCRAIEREVLATQASASAADEAEYELHQDDTMVAGTFGKRAYEEILRYAAQYAQDGPVELYKVVRTKLEIPATSSAASPTNGGE